MIEWIKFDENNKPDDRENILITDGLTVETGYYMFETIYPDIEMGMQHSAVTHWAKINLPDLP